MEKQKLYTVELKSSEGILKKVVVTANALIKSFSTDAKKIMFELRVNDLNAFNDMQKIIGIRQTTVQQTLWTDEIAKINSWFNDSENLMFFINKYACINNAFFGTHLNIKVDKFQKTDENVFIIDTPIDHNKFDFEKMQPRTLAEQNLLRFYCAFYDYVMSLYSSDPKQVDWKMTKYTSEISEYVAYKLMEQGYLGLDFDLTNKLFDEFTNGAYHDNERIYKDVIRNTVKQFQNKRLLVRDKTIIAKLLFDIAVENEYIDPDTCQLTDKSLEYIKLNQQKQGN